MFYHVNSEKLIPELCKDSSTCEFISHFHSLSEAENQCEHLEKIEELKIVDLFEELKIAVQNRVFQKIN